MDYYYNTTTPTMSTRGRFSTRGGSSYRGGGRGDSTYRGSRGGYVSSRGYSSSRGRGSFYPKYDSSTPKYSSDGPRYPSRMDDSTYRKPESSYASSRDTHHRSDIDIGRKRMRSDSYSQSQGTPGGRRSNEMDDYRGGASRYSNSYTESRSYSENRGVFKKPRISDYKPKEDYRGRKDIPRSSLAMSKLRSFRGRSIRGRPLIRRGGESFLSRKRAAFSGSRSTSEIIALRRVKLLRMKRLRDRARIRMEEEKAVAEDILKEEQQAAEKQQEEEKKEKEGEEKEGDEKTDEEKKDPEKKEDGEICDAEAEKEKEKKKAADERYELIKKTFMKLQCPQCNTKCITFKEYFQHLYHPTHVKAMRDKSEQLKKTLAKMRIAQRNKQKEVDEEDVSNMNARSIFCPICKLNYSQEKRLHQSSEAHKKLKNFLQPYCRICRISFKSPMLYERHICSLDHMRKKNALDERLGKTKNSSLEYLDNFMVVDSVGSGDEVEEAKEDKTEEAKEKKEDKSDENINLGVEFITKVEGYYCEVCRTYLPRIADPERVLRVHCRTKNHMRCYLRFGTDELLAKIQGKDKSDGEKPGENGEGKEHEGGGVGEEEGGIDEKLWADVSDLLSQVQPEAKSDDEEDDEGGRFDRFKSNEKKENGEVGPEEPQPGKEKGAVAEDLKVPVKEAA